MTQTHDVMIDGAGYMLVPGSYRYEQKGADIHPVRTGVPSFETRLQEGVGGPAVVDKDAVRWQAVGMMPLPIGLGDEAGRLILAPQELTVSSAVFDANSRALAYNGVFYFSGGANLYKVVTVPGGGFSSLAFIGAAGGTITSMCVSGGLLYMATTAAGTMSTYAGSGAIANTPAAAAQVVWDYARGIWRAKKDAVTGEWHIASGSFDGGATWTDWGLDATIKASCPWHGRPTGGGVQLIATQYMLWELVGQWATSGGVTAFSGTVSPLFEGRGGGNPDDFAALVPYQGRVYTWYAGGVQEWNGTRLLPVAGGPRGYLLGMCGAGGALCVSVQDPATLQYMIWLYDGVRWVMLARGATPYGQLAGSGGIIADGHLVSLNTNSSLSRWQMPVASLTGQPVASGQVIAGPLDGGAGDTVKTWTQLSVGWSTALYAAGTSAPANPGGNLLIEYSVDDGVNWTAAGTTVIGVGARSGLAVQALASVEAQRLLVRVTWTPTSAYAGLMIDSVYASGWRVGDVPKQEEWEFVVKVTEKMIRRDGSVDARSGETELLALRALAQAGRTFLFQDIDYDLNARAVTARVVEMKEKERKGDGTHFLESQIALTIVAVA